MFPTKRLDRSVPFAHRAGAPSGPLIAPATGVNPALVRVLRHLADEARVNGCAHHAVIHIALDEHWGRVVSAISLSDKYADWKTPNVRSGDIDAPACPLPHPVRLTQEELMAYAGWQAQALAIRNRPPLRGWLAVPLWDRYGRNFGMIEVTDRNTGDFTVDDEMHLLQFGDLVTLAVENVCLFQSAHETEASPHQPPHIVPRGDETILLAEDDELVRGLASHVLDLGGYRVLVASDGDAALAIAGRHAGPIDLLLADVVMPRLGGRPLADRLRAVHPFMKVLFISGYTSDVALQHGVVESDVAFLQKPFSTCALTQKVRDVLDSPR